MASAFSVPFEARRPCAISSRADSARATHTPRQSTRASPKPVAHEHFQCHAPDCGLVLGAKIPALQWVPYLSGNRDRAKSIHLQRQLWNVFSVRRPVFREEFADEGEIAIPSYAGSNEPSVLAWCSRSVLLPCCGCAAHAKRGRPWFNTQFGMATLATRQSERLLVPSLGQSRAPR